MGNPLLLWQIRLWIICGNLLTLAIFLSIGWYIDKTFGTGPKALIASLVLSFPFSQLLLITVLKKRFTSFK